MTQFDAAHAFDLGYHQAVCGGARVMNTGTWMSRFSSDYYEGWDCAVADGKWGTHPDYCGRRKG